MFGFSHRNARPMTSRLMDMMDSGEIDARAVADMALGWISEDSVKSMMQANDLPTADEEEEEESDPLDDFNYVGSRHHY